MMDGEEKLWVMSWITIGLTLIVLTLTMNHYSTQDVKYYTERNYCEVQKTGTIETMWTKCKDNKND